MAKVKICGITNKIDAKNASVSGADFLGFNFYRNSQRFIKPGYAKKIIESLPPKTKPVGVFVNEQAGNIENICRHCGISIVQLSGDEPLDFALKLKQSKTIKKIKIIKAYRIKKISEFKEKIISKNDIFRRIDYIMLDSLHSGFYGGTGKRFSMDSFDALKALINNRKLIIAGGLSQLNVKDAINKTHPFAVDVCTNVEKSPGIKDAKLVEDFIKEAKS